MWDVYSPICAGLHRLLTFKECNNMLITIPLGLLLGSVFYFAVAGWRKTGTPSHRARNAAGHWGLWSAVILMATIKAPGGNHETKVDLAFALISWLAIGIPGAVVIGLGAYLIYRIRAPKTVVTSR